MVVNDTAAVVEVIPRSTTRRRQSAEHESSTVDKYVSSVHGEDMSAPAAVVKDKLRWKMSLIKTESPPPLQ